MNEMTNCKPNSKLHYCTLWMFRFLNLDTWWYSCYLVVTTFKKNVCYISYKLKFLINGDIHFKSLLVHFKPFNKIATTTFARYKINMVIMSGYVMRKAMRWKLLPINKHCYVKKTHDLNILKKNIFHVSKFSTYFIVMIILLRAKVCHHLAKP